MARNTKKKNNKRSKKRTVKSGTKNYYRLLLSLIVVTIMASVWAIKSFNESPVVATLHDLKKSLEQQQPIKVDPSAVAEIIKERTTEAIPEKTSSTKKKTPAKAEPETAEASADYYYYTKAFDFHWPAYKSSDLVVEHSHYTLSYAEDFEQPYWIAYELRADHLEKNVKRQDNFREDPLVRTQSASLKDYYKSGYDRGHLAPAADFSWDEKAMSESFYMSNMSPQNPGFNRGIWKKLESQVRNWARQEKQLYVVTGPVLTTGLPDIGPNDVAVPDYYYKVVLDIREPEIKAIAFLMKNKSSKAPLKSFVVSIDSLEKTTGLDFFPMIPNELEQKLEATTSTHLWF